MVLITARIIMVIYVSVFYVANKYSVHAEKDAIMKFKNKNNLKYAKIIIVKLINNKLCPAKPCKMCMKLLEKYNMFRIYSIQDDKIIKI